MPTIRFKDTPGNANYASIFLKSSNIALNKISKNNGFTAFIVLRQDISSNTDHLYSFCTVATSNCGGYSQFNFSGIGLDTLALNLKEDIAQSNLLSPPKPITAVQNMTNKYDKTGHILTISANSLKFSSRSDGVSIFDQNLTNLNIDTSALGYLRIGQWVKEHYVGEVIIFRSGLKNSQIKTIENYLGQKWGIKVN